jgi:hypothetical protein
MKLSYKNVLVLRNALNSLEGREQAVEAKDGTHLVRRPFKFAGKTRLKIARDLRACEGAFEEYDAARVGLVRELAGGGEKVPEGKLAEFTQRHEELLKEEAEVALAPLTEAELNLDDNDVPHWALAVLLEHLVSTNPRE